jgi:hypothetical protein
MKNVNRRIKFSKISFKIHNTITFSDNAGLRALELDILKGDSKTALEQDVNEI